ncbi:unnamed protein product [Schistosoma curassoni]|nr:unnamed protein product [Schistosoma curassoni]
MQDLKDMTLDVHYENYRAKYITERMSKRQSDRREGVGTGALARLEKEGGTGFEAIVDQDSLLKQKEEELQRMQQLMSKMQEQLKRNTNVVPNASVGLNNGTSNTQSSPIPATGQQAS